MGRGEAGLGVLLLILFPPTHTANHIASTAFRHLPPNSARIGYATEGAVFISAQLSSDAVSALRKVWVQIKLQALVYDILPSTTAVFSYVTEGVLFISAQLSSDAVSALRKVRVLIRL